MSRKEANRKTTSSRYGDWTYGKNPVFGSERTNPIRGETASLGLAQCTVDWHQFPCRRWLRPPIVCDRSRETELPPAVPLTISRPSGNCAGGILSSALVVSETFVKGECNIQ